MPFNIVRNDITKMKVDAIVNTANPHPIVGAGTDTAVYKAAGFEQMLEERKKIGDIAKGTSAYTKGFNLPAKYVIHTVGNSWFGENERDLETIHNCYKNSLIIAQQLKCKSVAFPLLSTGTYGCPKDISLKIAIEEISSFLLKNDMDVFLVVYDLESFEISSKLFSGVQAFIDENYIAENIDSEYFGNYPGAIKDSITKSILHAEVCASFSEKIKPLEGLDEFLKNQTDNFQNTLQHFIAERNLSNAEVYHKSNIDKKLFSKIISTKNYIPKKRNVLAFVIGLELDLEHAEQLLSSAGYAFSNGEKLDLIVKYFILNKNYNIFELNQVLFKYNLPLLGNSIE